MFSTFRRAKTVVKTATIGGLSGAYALTYFLLRLEDEDIELEDTLRFLARSHATLSMLGDLLEEIYEESIRDGEVVMPRDRVIRKLKRRLKQLWLDDDVADGAGQMLLRGQNFRVH